MSAAADVGGIIPAGRLSGKPPGPPAPNGSEPAAAALANAVGSPEAPDKSQYTNTNTSQD